MLLLRTSVWARLDQISPIKLLSLAADVKGHRNHDVVRQAKALEAEDSAAGHDTFSFVFVV